MASHHLPPVKKLFSDSWELMKSRFVSLLVFYVLVIAITLAAFVVMGAGLVLLALALGITSGNAAAIFASIGLGAVLVVFLIAVSSAASIGGILILGRDKQKSAIETGKDSIPFIIPVFLAGLITMVLALGGVFLFIIPGIAISILFMFVNYAIILEHKKPIASLRRSFALVADNFGPVFIRLLAIWALSLLVSLIPGILSGVLGDDGSTVLFIQLINFVLQIGLSFYTMAYTLLLFRDVQTIEKRHERSLKPIVIVSAIGWVIGILLIYSFISILSQVGNGLFQSGPREATPEEIQEVFGDDLMMESDTLKLQEAN